MHPSAPLRQGPTAPRRLPPCLPRKHTFKHPLAPAWKETANRPHPPCWARSLAATCMCVHTAAAGGNVFVALAPVSTSETALANETLVTALAYRSDPNPTSCGSRVASIICSSPYRCRACVGAQPSRLSNLSPADWLLMPAATDGRVLQF